MSHRIQKYELTQNDRKYILSTQIEGKNVKIICKEVGMINPPEYIGIFSLDQLRQLSEFFNNISTINEAQELLNQTVENQKVSVEYLGNIINIILYFTKESEDEDSLAMKIELTNDVIYNKPIIYHSYVDAPSKPLKELPTQIISKTTESNIETVYSPVRRLPDKHTKLPDLETITNPTKEIFTNTNTNTNTNITSTSNETFQNYENYENYDNIINDNYDKYDNINININNETETKINTEEYNTYFNDSQFQYQNTDEKPYITPIIEETTQPQYTYEQYESYKSYDPNISSPKREQIQYTMPDSSSTAEISYSAAKSKKNPELIKQEKTVETKTTTTTQQNPSVDMNLYNQKISQLENEKNRIKQEYEKFVVDSNNLSTELGQLRAKVHILTEENKVLRERKSYKPDENQIQEISNLKQENEKQIREIAQLKQENQRLKNELEQNKGIQNTFEQYKKIKEEEVNYLKAQIEELLKNQRKNDEMLINKQKEINNLQNQNQIQLLRLSESQTQLQQHQQQANTLAKKLANQTLTIHNTHTELVKGEIIDSTPELELLTRKICKNYKKVTLDLLYKATVDTDKAAAFHKKCDWANRTLVLIKTGRGKRFGGYTSCSWKGDSIEKRDENAFVFSLDKMQIYDIIPGEDAIGCYPNFGPVFLGCQIRIYDDFFTNGGTTFERGCNYDTQEDYELTGGLKQFDVKEIEVYSVELQ